MATLEQIDRERPVFVTGFQRSISNDPTLIALAKAHNNERMRLVSSPVTDEITLPVSEASVLLGWIGDNELRFLVERNLQSLSAKPDGDLLTTWVTLSEFDALVVANKHEGPVGLRELLHRLATATENWKALGVDEVYIDGYAL